MRKRSEYPTFCHPSWFLCLYPSCISEPLQFLFSYSAELCFMSSSSVSPISSHLCLPLFFFCPTHPLLLTPKLSPLKNPGNKNVVPGLFISASVSTPLIHASQIDSKGPRPFIFYVQIFYPNSFPFSPY